MFDHVSIQLVQLSFYLKKLCFKMFHHVPLQSDVIGHHASSRGFVQARCALASGHYGNSAAVPDWPLDPKKVALRSDTVYLFANQGLFVVANHPTIL